MGWKNVKEHYQIEHFVTMRDGKIYIGSSYISNLMVINKDGTIHLCDVSFNEDFKRYKKEMESDIAKLRESIEAPDTFSKSITVYTYKDGDILEKQCEELGWPNVTHDGLIQYDNTFSPDKKLVISWAKQNAECAIESARSSIEQQELQLANLETKLQKMLSWWRKLKADYPDPIVPKAKDSGVTLVAIQAVQEPSK